MDTQIILRWLVTTIVLLMAVVLFGFVLQLASVILKLAIRFLLVFLLFALVLRVTEAIRNKR